MNAQPNIDMLEATRLTREGRLAEAMALLQGRLAGAHSSATSSSSRGDEGKPAAPFSRIIEMTPPSAKGGAWTPPKFDLPHHASHPLGGLTGGTAQTQVPEALRGFFDRMGQPGLDLSQLFLTS